jgi:biotin carboxyl carrier protein
MILSHPCYQGNNISTEFCETYYKELIIYALEKNKMSQLPCLIASAIAKRYLQTNPATIADRWGNLGYWRLAAQAIPITVDGQIYWVELHLNDKSKPSFMLNGTETKFTIVHESENCIEISISEVQYKIFYHSNRHGDINISMENIQYRLTFPGLLRNYPESVARSNNDTRVDVEEITSPLHGKVMKIYIKENQLIKKGDPLLVIEAMKSENLILSPRVAKVKKIAVEVGAQVSDRMPLIFLEDYNE